MNDESMDMSALMRAGNAGSIDEPYTDEAPTDPELEAKYRAAKGGYIPADGPIKAYLSAGEKVLNAEDFEGIANTLGDSYVW